MEELHGENFTKINSELLDIEIDVKMFIEKQIEMFFLYKCKNNNLKDVEKFEICTSLSEEIKEFIMFKNLFDFGFRNALHDILVKYELEEEFK